METEEALAAVSLGRTCVPEAALFTTACDETVFCTEGFSAAASFFTAETDDILGAANFCLAAVSSGAAAFLLAEETERDAAAFPAGFFGAAALSAFRSAAAELVRAAGADAVFFRTACDEAVFCAEGFAAVTDEAFAADARFAAAADDVFPASDFSGADAAALFLAPETGFCSSALFEF